MKENTTKMTDQNQRYLHNKSYLEVSSNMKKKGKEGKQQHQHKRTWGTGKLRAIRKVSIIRINIRHGRRVLAANNRSHRRTINAYMRCRRRRSSIYITSSGYLRWWWSSIYFTSSGKLRRWWLSGLRAAWILTKSAIFTSRWW